MTTKAILIVGPAGCGKTLHARALCEHFGCVGVRDSWRPSHGLMAGFLHLTNMMPGGPPLPYSDDTLDARTFDDAMREMNARHAALI